MSKLKNDFGVSALLATIALVACEVSVVLVLLLRNLDFGSTMTVLGLAQTPAMLALGFYFGRGGTKPTQPPAP